MNKKVLNNMNKSSRRLSKYACKNEEAIRLKPIISDFRPPFFRDSDKVIYSLSYTRYIDKTQVFSNVDNDMISKRMTHVQLVSKIARTIGRALNLNEDLIEAAGLGHDLGHVPYGHVGEKILNSISLRYGEGYFFHNVQSVRVLMNLENRGRGSNITLQVLDAIFCHNGESLKEIYYPQRTKNKDDFIREYNSSYDDATILKNSKPMTLEGCVVKLSDVIAYVGKDIEDAIRLNKIKITDVPTSISNILGLTNSEIVNTIVVDVIKNSYNKDYIKMSKKIYKSLCDLINFNYSKIYLLANNAEQLKHIELQFNKLFDLYYSQIINNEIEEDIFKVFLNEMQEEYLNSNTPARKVIDYISGMTDDYFCNQYTKYFG